MPELKTAREWIEGLGGVDKLYNPSPHILSKLCEAPRLFSSPGTGLLQVNSGGRVLLGMTVHNESPQGTHQSSCTVIIRINERQGEEWERKRQQGIPQGSKPFPRLELALIG